ncbi:GntR family transcriptional regulator [Streptomyces sp. G1]|uniref:GntR family transcriptional regulator n=1 Tax=Streptomyces sp. G1 TaxID=361572 RepID=UPI00202FF581|nr:winged helix-turn-helix domain-containing protein [Streptomyces sp. G1]MCM1974017.1 winged helix-turn-helix domain-containing protein [Streptomyces sp. G1]
MHYMQCIHRSRSVITLRSVTCMIDPTSEVPRWRQAHAILVDRIRSGTYPPGSRVPSVVALTEELGISTPTAQKALRQLREDGLTYTVPGLGSYVADQPRA